MEIIRKKICIDDYRSRVIGMMPYIEYNSGKLIISDNTLNGNYGSFPINPLINGKTEIYMDIMRNYYFLKEQFRNGVKLKKVIRDNQETWIIDFYERKTPYEFKVCDINDFIHNEFNVYRHKNNLAIDSDYIVLVSDFEGFINKGDISYIKYVDENIIGLFYIPSNLECKITSNNNIFEEIGCPIPGIKLPEYVFYKKIDNIYNEMLSMSGSTNPCILKKWEEMGGKAYMDLLISKKTEYVRIKNTITEMTSLATTSDMLDVTIPSINISLLLTTKAHDMGIMTSYDEDEEYTTIINGLEPKSISPENYKVASQLSTLRIKDFFYDDNGDYLPGIFVEDNYYYYITNGEITGKVNGTTFSSDYMSFTLNSTLPNDYNGVALIKYKNDTANPMKIPYSINKPINTYALKEYIPMPYIIVEPKGYLFINEYSKIFKVTTNSIWSVNSIDDWVTCNPNDGNANGKDVTYEMLVTVSGGDITEKVTTLNFTAGEGEYQVKVSYDLIVMSEEAYIELINTPNVINVSYANQSINITFKSNVKWSATCPNWCTLSEYSGEKGDNINLKLSINKNESTISQRIGDIIIKSNDIIGVQTRLTIIQGVSSTLNISPNVITLIDNYSKEELSIISNGYWEVESSAEWCTLSKTNGNGNATIIVGRNYYGETQEQCFITVKGEGKTQECIVYATSTNGIILLEPLNNNIIVPYNGSNFDVVIIAYCDRWEVVFDENILDKQWIKVNTLSGNTGKNTIQFECEENNTYSDRNGVIKIVSIDDPKYYIELFVVQSYFLPEINVSPTDLMFMSNNRTQKLTVYGNIPWKATTNLNWITFNNNSNLDYVIGPENSVETITLSVNNNINEYLETGDEGTIDISSNLPGTFTTTKASVYWEPSNPQIKLSKIYYSGTTDGVTTYTGMTTDNVINLPCWTGIVNVEFYSNSRWKFNKESVDWIHTYGVTTGKTSTELQNFEFVIGNNYNENGSEPRETNVSFSLRNWPDKQPISINIKQEGNNNIIEPYILLLTEPTATTINFRTQEIINKIKYNTSWQFVENPSGWITSNRNGTVHGNGKDNEETIIFTAKTNTSLEDREITCTYMLSNYPDVDRVSYKITQKNNAKTVNITLKNTINFSDRINDLPSKYWNDNGDGRYVSKLRVIFYINDDEWNASINKCYATMTIYATPDNDGFYSNLEGIWDDDIVKMIIPKVSYDINERYDRDINIKIDTEYNSDQRLNAFSAGHMYSISNNLSNNDVVDIVWPEITIEIVY